MPTRKKPYKKAPIVEAVIHIRAQFKPIAKGVTLVQALELVAADLKDDYTETSPILMQAAELHLGIRPAFNTNQQQIGWRLNDGKRGYVVQLRTDGLAVSKLALYDRWSSFSKEAGRIWSVLKKHVKVITKERLAVRYINRLDIPHPKGRNKGIDLSKYLRLRPQVPHHSMTTVASYKFDMTFSVDPKGTNCVVRQANMGSPLPNHSALLLDIDVFRNLSSPHSDMEMWRIFNYLRRIKNKIFEDSLTPRIKKEFDR